MTITIGADLLHEIADAIEARPEAYNQGNWISANDDLDIEPLKGFKLLTEGACGTTACVAGWAVALNSKDKKIKSIIKGMDDNDSVADLATNLLWPHLTKDECDRLFQADWAPRHSKSVPSALRKIAKGKSVDEV